MYIEMVECVGVDVGGLVRMVSRTRLGTDSEVGKRETIVLGSYPW